MSLGTLCNRETIVVGREEAIAVAARLMREYHVGSLVVVEPVTGGNRPIGILTDRDLVVEILAPKLEPGAVTVGDVMSFELVTASEDETVWDALERMRARGVRRMPVVDGQGLLVGILSSDDVLEVLAEELGHLVKIIGRERRQEATARIGPG